MISPAARAARTAAPSQRPPPPPPGVRRRPPTPTLAQRARHQTARHLASIQALLGVVERLADAQAGAIATMANTHARARALAIAERMKARREAQNTKTIAT